MYAIDLHVHSRFFHGFERAGSVYDPLGYRLVATAARLRGLDGLALTNHDYWRAFDPVAGLATVPGIEVSTTDGHVLVVGPDPPGHTDPGALTPAETVALAHDRGCAAIIAHPFRNSTVRDAPADFDAVEVNGKSPGAWELSREVAERRDLPVVGGSDAHFPFEVGRAYTLVDAENPTPEAVADAIRRGDVSVGVAGGRAHRLLQRVYGAIHRWKGQVAGPDDGGPSA